MPAAMLRACSWPGGCGELVESGRCPAHAKAGEQARGSSAARGYGAEWRRFAGTSIEDEGAYRKGLMAALVLPVCGARMPGLPLTGDSQCQSRGLLMDDTMARRMYGRRLHTDHTPPLSQAERLNQKAVCDIERVQLLCEHCHNAKTQREQQRGGA